jgi:hypothetical protein
LTILRASSNGQARASFAAAASVVSNGCDMSGVLARRGAFLLSPPRPVNRGLPLAPAEKRRSRLEKHQSTSVSRSRRNRPDPHLRLQEVKLIFQKFRGLGSARQALPWIRCLGEHMLHAFSAKPQTAVGSLPTAAR